MSSQTLSSLNGTIKKACDILRRSNCAGALQYVPELTWLLFLRILDDAENEQQTSAAILGGDFTQSLEAPYRWRDWGAPDGEKRIELTQEGKFDAFYDWVNADLIPHLKSLGENSRATARQKVIAEIMEGRQSTGVDTERNLLDVIDVIHSINPKLVDATHVFPLSQVYESLLLKMGEKGNDGGQFFTPREVIRVMVRAIGPTLGQTIYDPCCGTGGFLAQAYDYLFEKFQGELNDAAKYEFLKRNTFYGREKEKIVYPIALANLMLHGMDEPHIWHGNALTNVASYAGLWTDGDGGPAPETFDIILTNPPFGGKENKDARTRYAYQTGATQILFLQEIIKSLKNGGKAAVVVDEGVLFRSNESAFVGTKKLLLEECNLWCVLSLPPGTFVNAGAGVKTNILFFTKGEPTKSIWYYDLGDIKVGKRTPLTLSRFDEFFEHLPTRADSERSWSVGIKEIAAKNYDLKAVNPTAPDTQDKRSVEELLAIIEQKGTEVQSALAGLRLN